jgi:hypothetical protein
LVCTASPPVWSWSAFGFEAANTMMFVSGAGGLSAQARAADCEGCPDGQGHMRFASGRFLTARGSPGAR